MNIVFPRPKFPKKSMLAILVGLQIFGSVTTLFASANVGTFKERIESCSKASATDIDNQSLILNRFSTNQRESGNIRWIGHCVMPFLQGTTRERAHIAALSTWWSLREGNLEMETSNLIRYSNCHLKGKDTLISDQPLTACPDKIWQVGLAKTVA